MSVIHKIILPKNLLIMIANMTFSICKKAGQIYLYHFDTEKSSFTLLGVFNSCSKAGETYVYYNKDTVMIVFSQTGVYLTLPSSAHIIDVKSEEIFFEKEQQLYLVSDDGKITPIAKSASDTLRMWKNDKDVYFVSYIFKKAALADFSVDDSGNVRIKNDPFRGYILRR